MTVLLSGSFLNDAAWIDDFSPSLICRKASARDAARLEWPDQTGAVGMWISKDDFQIRSENFDLTNGLNILRIICGLFMFPHVMGKFAAGAVSAGTAAFFAKAGFHPPEVWVYVAAIAETAAAVALILGICTRFAAVGAAALLGVAVYSLQVVKGFGWTWNTGGYEYPVFWAITSLAVAIEAWKAHLRLARPALATKALKVAA